MRNNKGFSLVELIVVIAIMAILAAVAVIGVSVYIPKAQQANDKQLVSDIEYALNLYYQGNPEIGGGFVVITTEDMTAGGSGIEAMKAVFGNDWESNKLAYEKWGGDDAMLTILQGYIENDELDLIANSSFANIGTAGLLTAVTDMTGIISDVIDTRNNGSAAESRKDLVTIFGEESDIVKQFDQLSAEGMTDGDSSTVISNLLVGSMADTMGESPALTHIINEYAAAYAYSQTPGGDDVALKKMQANLATLDMNTLTATDVNVVNGVLYAGFEDSIYDGYKAYNNSNSDVIQNDKEALEAMMGAVKEISGNYQDLDSLKNANLYKENAEKQVNDYLSTIQTLANLSDEELAILSNLPENAIVVFMSADGVVSVFPSLAQ